MPFWGKNGLLISFLTNLYKYLRKIVNIFIAQVTNEKATKLQLPSVDLFLTTNFPVWRILNLQQTLFNKLCIFLYPTLLVLTSSLSKIIGFTDCLTCFCLELQLTDNWTL